jgi:hypothetical protein
MRLILAAAALSLIAFAGPALAQRQYPWRDMPPRFRTAPWSDRGAWNQVPNLDGTWYFNGDWNQPAQIFQRWPDNQALFVNEQGSQAWGIIRGNQIWIPDWNNGQGQSGTVRGNRIEFPGGSFWSR